MLDLAVVRQMFPELTEIEALAPPSGQKYVFRAKKGAEIVVLKLLRPGPDQMARVQREIAAVAKLDSPYVPRLYDHGMRKWDGGTQYFLFEEYIKGETFAHELKRNPVQPLSEVLRLVYVLLTACTDFEKNNLVHRDIKPANIMVGNDDKFWVIDFGIVRFLDMESLTQTSQRFGPCTPGYGAPEQMRNLKAQINIRADLFSVGVVAYEALKGHNPYTRDKRDILEIISHMEKQDLTPLQITGDVDGQLSGFISSMTARFPSRRPQSATQALEWFRPIRERLEGNG